MDWRFDNPRAGPVGSRRLQEIQEGGREREDEEGILLERVASQMRGNHNHDEEEEGPSGPGAPHDYHD